MAKRIARRARSEAALFVALMLVVQALLSGLSLGLGAASSDGIWQIDASGLIICTRDGGTATAPGEPGTAHHGSTDCCTLGCSMVGALTPDLPREPAIYPQPSRSLGVSLARIVDPQRQVGHTPQNPRAPPILA